MPKGGRLKALHQCLPCFKTFPLPLKTPIPDSTRPGGGQVCCAVFCCAVLHASRAGHDVRGWCQHTIHRLLLTDIDFRKPAVCQLVMLMKGIPVRLLLLLLLATAAALMHQSISGVLLAAGCSPAGWQEPHPNLLPLLLHLLLLLPLPPLPPPRGP